MDIKESVKIAVTVDQLPDELKDTVVSLMDIKTNSDMKEVITEIKNMQAKMELDTNSIRSEFRVLYWVIGAVGVTLFGTLLGMILK